jgi:hypothetical protein
MRIEYNNVKFSAYVAYLVISLILESAYLAAIRDRTDEAAMDEKDWEARFEYTSKIPQPSGTGDLLSDDSDEEPPELKAQKAADLAASADLFNASKKKDKKKQSNKKEYSDYDLVKKYDDLRFRLEFLAFRMMAWWPIFDNIAMYGQLVNTGLIVYVSISEQVSFYMFFNLVCIAI